MLVKVYSFDRTESVNVEVDNINEKQYASIRNVLFDALKNTQAYSAIARGYIHAITLCPLANPSDLWQHVLYRAFIESGRNEQSWKRASGQAFENAFVDLYNPRFIEHGIRLVVLSQTTANKALEEMSLTGKIAPSKMDIAIEGNCGETGDPQWKIFGVVHAKTSIAERIKDDAPASKIIMDNGFFSVLATLDSKSFPPPHGNGINYGELGGRTAGQNTNGQQVKRGYFEKDGDFHYGYSYNLRTPPTEGETLSGCKIKTLSFSMNQPDEFVQDTTIFWQSKRSIFCAKQPTTEVLDTTS